MIKPINQLNYSKLFLGNSGLTVADAGCYSACLAMVTGRSMEELVKLFNKKGVYNRGGYIKHPDDRKALDLDEYYSTMNTPEFLCIAEVDFKPDPKKQQHFVVWIGDGRIIDPWGGAIRENPYKVYNFRIYKKLKIKTEDMSEKSGYHFTSKLERVGRKIDEDLDGDSKDGQKDFAKKLDKFIDEKEALEKSRLSNEEKEELNTLRKFKNRVVSAIPTLESLVNFVKK